MRGKEERVVTAERSSIPVATSDNDLVVVRDSACFLGLLFVLLLQNCAVLISCLVLPCTKSLLYIFECLTRK